MGGVAWWWLFLLPLVLIIGAAFGDAVDNYRKDENKEILQALSGAEKRRALIQLFIVHLCVYSVVGVAALIPFAVYLVFIDRPEWLLRQTQADYIIFVFVVLGVAAFWLRCRSPLFYGIVEVAVAIAAMTATVSSPGGDLLVRLVGLAGGMYILVRGFDNIDKGLTRRRRWDALFWRHKPKDRTGYVEKELQRWEDF